MIDLREAKKEDLKLLYSMQLKAFSALYEKYQDKDTSPAAESFERTLQRFSNTNVTYYLILEDDNIIGSIRVRKQDKIYVLVQILILPEYQNRGLAQLAIKKVESLYPDAEYWRLDTIAQEDKLCHLYSKMGYQKTGEIEHIKDGMDIVFFEKQRGCGQNPGHFDAEKKLWHHVIPKNKFMPHSYCIANYNLCLK